MRKEERAEIIINAIDEMFPDAECELVHDNPLQLLIAVVLSAQTTDQSVNKVTKKLFEKYKTVQDYANADIKEMENDIRQIGLYRNKAKNIIGLANALIENFNGEVPHTKKELETLPGVGRKTANVVVSVAFGEPALAVDTHVERVSKRLKLAKKDDSVLDVEKKLCRVIPKERWSKTHHQLIFFGRYFCKSASPSCANCPLFDICQDPIRFKKRPIDTKKNDAL